MSKDQATAFPKPPEHGRGLQSPDKRPRYVGSVVTQPAAMKKTTGAFTILLFNPGLPSTIIHCPCRAIHDCLVIAPSDLRPQVDHRGRARWFSSSQTGCAMALVAFA
jgi:hypothetical protein